MGEVYRAHDTKLNRDVAIKVLPELFAADPDRVARFEREAQALAALNHPYIAHIYGVIEHPAALVMELVEGEDLAHRIARGALPIDEALPIARQIAEALEAAHERGIVHRDLKPANVKISHDGVVKVLDFGLAMMGAGPASGSRDNSPTFTSPAMLTQAGVILGTAAYMAPEQARGKPIDRRADIWAFGCLLFEMLTGRRPFVGSDLTETLAAIVRDPPDLAALPPAAPAQVAALIARCLEKDPHRRLRDIGEARVTLEDALQPDAAVRPSARAAEPVKRNVPGWASAVLGVLVLLLAGAVVMLERAPHAAGVRVMRFDIDTPPGSTLHLAERPALTISPDGSVMAFVVNANGKQQIFVRRRDDADAHLFVSVPVAAGATSPDIELSPDDRFLAYTDGSWLNKAPLDGGPIVPLARVNTGTRGLAWADAHTIVYTDQPRGGLWIVDADGGTPRALTKAAMDNNERSHRWPAPLPGGKAVIFTVGALASPDSYDDANIDAVVLATGQRKRILEHATFARYAPGGRLVFLRGGSLYAVNFDPETLTVSSAPVLVLQAVAADANTGAAHAAIADDGALLYVSGSPTANLRRLVWVDRSGAEQPVPLEPAVFNDPVVSPDGGRLALLVGPVGHADIWIYDLRQTTFSRWTFDGNSSTPHWSQDGRAIYYASIDTASRHTTIYRGLVDGSQKPEALATIAKRAYLGSIDEARQLAFVAVNDFSGPFDIVALSLKGAAPTPLVATPLNDYGPAESPNGRWFAYNSEESGHREVYVGGLGVSGGRVQISTGGGEEPRWAADGRTLFYRVDDRLMAVPIDKGEVFAAGKPVTLFRGVYNLQSESGESYDVDPKTGRLLMIRLADEHATDSRSSFHVVLNWTSELDRVAAARK